MIKNFRKFNYKKLLIATSNKGKLVEFQALLAPLNIEVVSLQDFDIKPPEETGKNFRENADLKAIYYSQMTNLPALADDSGLCVERLDNAPGIYSARLAGEQRNFKIAIDKIQDELKNKGYDSSKAFFVCSLSLCFLDKHIENFEGRIDGKLSFDNKYHDGFGYDPIFIPDNYDLTFAELDKSVKNKISHRGLAIKKLLASCF